jgi:hypothetical protein
MADSQLLAAKKYLIMGRKKAALKAADEIFSFDAKTEIIDDCRNSLQPVKNRFN